MPRAYELKSTRIDEWTNGENDFSCLFFTHMAVDVERQRARTRMEEQRGGRSDAEQQRQHGARAPLPPQSELFLHGQSEHGHRQHDAPPAPTPTSRLIVKGIPKYAD